MMRSNLFCVMQLQEVAFLNKEGVHSLAACQAREALCFFQTALQALHQIEISMSFKSGGSDKETAQRSQPHIWSSAMIPDLSSYHGHGHGRSSGNNDLKDDDVKTDASSSLFFVYDQALIVSPSQDGIISSSHLRFYSAAIAFNMGLAFHLKGNHEQLNKAASSLRKATLCYQQALVDMNGTTSVSGGADANMMKLLALNNYCQIQYQLRNLTELQTGLEQIRKLSPTSILRCQSPVFQKQEGRRVITELMLNVLVCSNFPINAAPAA